MYPRIHKPGQVTISREKIYKSLMSPGSAWKYCYSVSILDGKHDNYSSRGFSLIEAKTWAKCKSKELGDIPIVIDWEVAEDAYSDIRPGALDDY